MDDPIGDDVVIGEVSKKSMKASPISEAVDIRMEEVKQTEVTDETRYPRKRQLKRKLLPTKL